VVGAGCSRENCTGRVDGESFGIRVETGATMGKGSCDLSPPSSLDTIYPPYGHDRMTMAISEGP
jgi:hypothetical protein